MAAFPALSLSAKIKKSHINCFRMVTIVDRCFIPFRGMITSIFSFMAFFYARILVG